MQSIAWEALRGFPIPSGLHPHQHTCDICYYRSVGTHL